MIVLAGGIGTGKSVVARVLRLQGYGVFDCDYEARVLMENDPSLRERLQEILGEDIYDLSAGSPVPDRRVVARRIFGDGALRDAVNAAVHEAVKKRMREWLEEDPGNVFVETAIAAESGIVDEADEVWIIDASEETRLGRVMERDRRPVEEIKRIMEIQAGEEEQMRLKGVRTRVIRNNPSDMILPVLREYEKRLKNQIKIKDTDNA